MATRNVRKRRSSAPEDTLTEESAEIVDILSRGDGVRRSALDMTDSPSRGLPQASEELAAAVRETGDAVHVIIDQAEAILDDDGADNAAYRATVRSAMLRILEVCAFEDLTGQRIAKAAEVLRRIEQSETAQSDQTVRSRTAQPNAESRLDGPALNAPHMSQTEIDAAFVD